MALNGTAIIDVLKDSSNNGKAQRSLPASMHLEWQVLQTSSHVFVYDLAEHVGFGGLTKEWTETASVEGAPVVLSYETRAGAGLSLAGLLQGAGSSQSRGNAKENAIFSVYNTPTGLAAMAPSFQHVPPPTSSSRLVFHVPNATPIGDALELTPTLAPFAAVVAALPETFSVVLSSTPQETLAIASVAYKVTDSHVIHVFDHHSAGREIGHALSPETSNNSAPMTISDALQVAGFKPFEYAGDPSASVVIVLLNGPIACAAKIAATRIPGLGVLAVRLLRPWSAEAFWSAIPETANTIHVVDDVPTELTQGALYMDVLSATMEIGGSRKRPSLRTHKVTPALTLSYIKSPSSFLAFLADLAQAPTGTAPALVDSSAHPKNILFLGSPASRIAHLPLEVAKAFLKSDRIQTRLLQDYDILSKPGGISITRMIVEEASNNASLVPLTIALPLGSEDPVAPSQGVDLLIIFDHTVLKTHSIVGSLHEGTTLMVVTSWTADELASNLPDEVLSTLDKLHVRVYLLNTDQLGAQLAPLNDTQVVTSHLAFLRLYLGPLASEGSLSKLTKSIYANVIEGTEAEKLSAKVWAALEEVQLHPQLNSASASSALAFFQINSYSPQLQEAPSTLPGAYLSAWHDGAKRILFPDIYTPDVTDKASSEEYPQDPSLRPEVPDRTFLVTCTVNRRLTPLEYDRNVFHLEFDTSGTGLKYAIGEALGVHGWNDEQEVHEFCQWYGVDTDQLITLPIPSGDGVMHTRTLFQCLQQQVDIFGRPPRSFYTDLAEHATSKADRLTLQFIGSQEGASMFKKLSETETVTFADVLRRFSSARPRIELLCEMIGDIKPRHYSIASAQSVVGDRVDLLVVTVEWSTPSGSPRCGQCTRYLAELKIGQKATVSIKPSVMKLPPDNMQPLILAGLGTGAAPFRAFLQHRAWLSTQGIPVGPLYYYFGARYRSQEYLYGEEIEAFILDKIITHAGLAFSRDGRKKVYIQHQMLEDAEVLVKMLNAEKGVFYLCGPTWPVPDVYETLVTALVKYQGMEPTKAAEYLEGLKEEERYVLEVY